MFVVPLALRYTVRLFREAVNVIYREIRLYREVRCTVAFVVLLVMFVYGEVRLHRELRCTLTFVAP